MLVTICDYNHQNNSFKTDEWSWNEVDDNKMQISFYTQLGRKIELEKSVFDDDDFNKLKNILKRFEHSNEIFINLVRKENAIGNKYTYGIVSFF